MDDNKILKRLKKEISERLALVQDNFPAGKDERLNLIASVTHKLDEEMIYCEEGRFGNIKFLLGAEQAFWKLMKSFVMKDDNAQVSNMRSSILTKINDALNLL